MRWYNPMDAAFAARIHDKSKFANAAKAVLDNNDFRHLIADMEGMTLEDGPQVLA